MYNDIYQAQRALVSHLKTGNVGAYNCKHIKEYAGELGDVNKLRDIMPSAALVRLMEGPAAGETPRDHRFYIIILTRSDSYDKKSNRNNNLQLASDIGKYLDDNPAWQFTDDDEETVEYILDRERLISRILFQDNSYTCIYLEAMIKILI
jgi:hypothetical protein